MRGPSSGRGRSSGPKVTLGRDFDQLTGITVKRVHVTLRPDRTRVLLRPFHLMSDQRALNICARVMALPESEVHAQLEQLRCKFGERHLKTSEFLRRRFDEVQPCLLTSQKLTEERDLLLGAYLTQEYALEGAALFNPSIVPHPDQSGLPPGTLRFILSLRATGEGHISSITFRTGLLDAQCNITIDAPSPYCLEPAPMPNAACKKRLFEAEGSGTWPGRRLQPAGSQRPGGAVHVGRITHQRQSGGETTPDS